MQSLLVQVEGRVLRFDGPRLIRIGRSIEADVVMSAGSVSRQHAEIRAVDDGWVLVDTGSQYGTFIDGARVTERPIKGALTVQCGPERTSTLVITPEQQASPEIAGPSAPPAPVPQPDVPAAAPLAPDTTPSTPPPRMPNRGPIQQPAPSGDYEQARTVAPGAPPGDHGRSHTRSGPDLLIVAEGREFRYRHPADVTLGRQPACDIVISDPACSRMHGQVSAVPGGWEFRNHSGAGSFAEGRRIEHRVFDERLALRLGHPVAGPEVSLVPILSSEEEERRFARKRRRKVLMRTGAIVAAFVLLAGSITTAVLLSGNDGASTTSVDNGSTLAVLTQDELESAKAATVLLVGNAPGPGGDRVQFNGSGSILTADGLILTNAHVAQPTAEGLDEYYGDDGVGDPNYLLVALVNGMDDTPASPSYRARPVEVDGYRDVAVLQIYADADGARIDTEDLDLPTMPIGDSDAVESGDDVTVLGFPGISMSTRLSVTKGVISTFIDREDLGPRSEIDTDARIAPGNSGGAAIDNDARIIGIPSATFTSDGPPVVSGRIRPINFVKDVIEDAMQQ